MRETEVSGFVPASSPVVLRALTPEAVVTREGTFEVREVTRGDEGTHVTAAGPGIVAEFRFEERSDGLYYEQVGENGPFESMATRITVRPRDDGSDVTLRSEVSLGLPIPGADRVAAWKRRGELKRALDGLRSDVG